MLLIREIDPVDRDIVGGSVRYACSYDGCLYSRHVTEVAIVSGRSDMLFESDRCTLEAPSRHALPTAFLSSIALSMHAHRIIATV